MSAQPDMLVMFRIFPKRAQHQFIQLAIDKMELDREAEQSADAFPAPPGRSKMATSTAPATSIPKAARIVRSGFAVRSHAPMRSSSWSVRHWAGPRCSRRGSG